MRLFKKRTSNFIRRISQLKVKSSSEAEYYDKEIARLVLDDKHKLEIGILLWDLPFLIDEETLQLLIYSIEKQQKSQDDIIFISHYLTTFLSLVKMVKARKANFQPMEIFFKISDSLKVEYHPQDSILFRLGEIGDKFYLIVKGAVSVIVKKEITMDMSKFEYINYLKYLVKIKEIELAECAIISNLFQVTRGELSPSVYEGQEIENPFRETPIEYAKISTGKLVETSVSEYVSRVTPKINQVNGSAMPFTRKPFTLWIYYYVCDLEPGATFGEVAMGGNFKRTATIICSKDCILGTLKKDVYEKCIKEMQERIRKNDILDILNCEVFNPINHEVFEKFYFNFFKRLQLGQGTFLFRQGEKREKIFFLKEGEIEINITSTFDEITKLLNKKGARVNDKKDKNKAKEKFLFNIYYYKTLKTMRLLTIKEKGLLGTDDYILDETFFCSAACCSGKAEVYEIDIEIFKEILLKEPRCGRRLKKYTNLREALIIDRIIHLRKANLEKQFNAIIKKEKEMTPDLTFEIAKKKIQMNRNAIIRSFSTSRVQKKEEPEKNLLCQAYEEEIKEVPAEEESTHQCQASSLNTPNKRNREPLNSSYSILQSSNDKISVHFSSINKGREKTLSRTQNISSSSFRRRKIKSKNYIGLRKSTSEELLKKERQNVSVSTFCDLKGRAKNKHTSTIFSSAFNSQSNSFVIPTPNDISYITVNNQINRYYSTKRILIPSEGMKKKQMKEVQRKVLMSSYSLPCILDSAQKKNYDEICDMSSINLPNRRKPLLSTLIKRKMKQSSSGLVLSSIDFLAMDKAIEASQLKKDVPQYKPKPLGVDLKKLGGSSKVIKIPRKNPKNEEMKNILNIFSFNK